MEKKLKELQKKEIRNLFSYLDLIKDNLKIANITFKSKDLFEDNPINVALISEYSAGKTTFIQRLFRGAPSGPIDPTPTTWVAIKHSYGNSSLFTIHFKDNIRFVNEQQDSIFRKFLEKFHLDKGFHQSVTSWSVIDSNIFTKTDKFGTTKILEFLKEAEPFSNAIVSIDWVHSTKSSEVDTLLSNVNIYDLPGLNGEIKHNEKIMNFLKTTSNINAYIIVIESDQGIPNMEFSKILLSKIFSDFWRPSMANIPIFWMYQKYSDINFEENRKEKIWDALKKSNETVAATLVHLKENSFVVDARGDQYDDLVAHMAMTKIIIKTKVGQIKQHLNALRTDLDEITKIPPLLGSIEKKPLDPIEFILKHFVPTSRFKDAVKGLRNILGLDLLDKVTLDAGKFETLIEDICDELYIGILNKDLDRNKLYKFNDILEKSYKLKLELLQQAFLHDVYKKNKLGMFYQRDLNGKLLSSITGSVDKLEESALKIC